MTDTGDTKALEQPSDAKDRRLSVFESVDGERKPLGIVTFHRLPDNNWELKYRGVAEAPEKLMLVLQSFTENRKEAGAAPLSAFVPSLSELATALQAQGFVTEEIPAADHQINFRIDMDTGGVIGTGSALHAQAGDSASIQRQIVESVSKIFKDAGPQLASELKPLLDSNDQPAAVQALKAAVDKGLFSFCRAPELLDQLLRLDVSDAIDEDRRLVAECRVILSTRLHRYEDLEDDAEFLLASTPGADNTEKGIALQTVKALASIQRGHLETGLSSLQALIALPGGMSAEGRAWTWRNIAITLQDPDRNREGALQAAELSADAFWASPDFPDTVLS